MSWKARHSMSLKRLRACTETIVITAHSEWSGLCESFSASMILTSPLRIDWIAWCSHTFIYTRLVTVTNRHALSGHYCNMVEYPRHRIVTNQCESKSSEARVCLRCLPEEYLRFLYLHECNNHILWVVMFNTVGHDYVGEHCKQL